MDTPFLEGTDIYLREVRAEDADGPWYAWLNDAEVTRYQNKGIFPNTREATRAYLERIRASSTDVLLAICLRADGTHIGCTGLHHIDWVHRSAELGIVIGEREHWGKGYGREAWRLVTAYGFRRLNLHRIYAQVFAQNTASLRCAEAAGFRKVGEIPDAFFKDGAYHAVVVLNLLAHEFED